MTQPEGVVVRVGQYVEAKGFDAEIEELEHSLDACAHMMADLEREQASLDSRRRVLDGRIRAIARHIKRLKALPEEEEA